MLLYSDLQSQYLLLDFLATHDQLLFRSLKNSKREYNVDIIFKGANNLLLPSILKGIEITETDKTNKDWSLLENFGFESKHRTIFSVKNVEGRQYYINAGAFGIFHNRLDTLETSLGRYDRSDLGEMISWYK